MPLNRDHAQFLVLFLCVPIQYLAVEYMGSNEVSRTYAISQMVTQFKEVQTQWLRVEPWKKWCLQMVLKLREGRHFVDDGQEVHDMGESPAFEVLKYREKDGYFSQSAEVRNPKSPHVKYRVGQVVKHKLWGYHGVIVGWDETARAPESWIKQMHGDNAHWRTQPNYHILVDTRDRPAPQFTYVPQENLEIVKQVKILHPSIEEYFESFDGSQYLARPWLKGVYPKD
ncbi:hypothetical protein TCAL_01946 [Tigriopus californicus]|uniref:Hemimethylated DNA-binding domain-containing protein n=1 Tax=Tigriopus californicus TaxID=6832 RepID=A0A553P7W9_TIGCA|nr:F-box only protein 21-like [Tigriopus californicus]TRY73788.1 hypothetical protein TCAL_01946 [Tigriopus californicus]|eukprot:TCALIF_01946-PA protein Name:"Similar to FBXO21 F-box only protein 21 (Homo sapiens)" AED:0.00 eAED:0.00 QI:447/1/1/1/0/0/2/208/226